jgi:ABC-type Na+ efflux pump permease subunit
LFREALPLAGYEIKRNLRLVVVLPLMALWVVLLHEDLDGVNGPAYSQVQGALSLFGTKLMYMMPILAGVAGVSVADERRRGVTLLLLARGMTRGRYLLGKLLGAAASAAILTAAAVACFYVFVGSRWPWGQVTYEREQGLATAFLGPGNGPVPVLYLVSPLANDLLLAAMHMAAAAGWSTVAVLAGVLTTNRYAVMAVPFLLAVADEMADAKGALRLLDPFTYRYLTLQYPLVIPAPYRPYAAFLYWLTFAIVVGALARWVFARKEAA